MRLEKHYLPIAAALVAGCAAAAIALVIPIGVMENFTASSGLSEIIPQTAPPLGATARMGIAFVAAVVVAGIVLALLGNSARSIRGNKEETPMSASPLRMPRFGGINRSDISVDNDAMSAETNAEGGTPDSWFARVKNRLDAMAGRETGEERGICGFDDLPRLHRPDRHPDAPPRRPIFASADLADLGEGFAASEPAASPDGHGFEDKPLDLTTDIAAPRPVPVSPTPAEPQGWRPLGAPPKDHNETGETDEAITAGDGRTYADLDLNDLVDRLERRLRPASTTGGIAPAAGMSPPDEAPPAPIMCEPKMAQDAAELAEIGEHEAYEPEVPTAEAEGFDEDALPPLSPRPVQAVPATDKSGDEMDEALQAALETLERMNSRRA